MRLVKGMLMGIGTFALATSLLNLVAPQVVRGAAAVLVDVANTTAAPALTLDISRSASQHVDLQCGSKSCNAQGSSSAYVVPAGQNLVVTSIDIQGIGGGGSAQFSIVVPATGYGTGWKVPNDGNTHSFVYPSGWVFPAGFQFQQPPVFGDSNFDFATLEGFLTPI